MGRIALVTGASRGIGAAIADRLEARGDTVLRVSRHGPLPADVTVPADRDRIVEAVATHGRLDLLVHSVGTNVRRPTVDYDAPTWHHVMATNAEPVFDLSRRLHPYLCAGEAPSIVMLSSVAAARVVRTSSAAYAMSKGAVEALVRFLAVEWAPDGIRVNAVAPWYVATPLVDEVLNDPAKREAVLAVTPLGRIGRPGEVADAVLYLAGAEWVTGVVLPVDGGFSARGS